MKELFGKSEGSAGARSISDMTADKETPLSRYRVRHLMKKLGLVSCQIPNHIYNKMGDEHLDIPNYLDRQFNVESPDGVWCGDVTYIWTGKRWAYLAMVVDLYARKPVGWAIFLSPNSELTSNALKMAYESRG